MKIHQFHSGTAMGDAITNQMLLLKKVLISNGYESEIYAEYVGEGLRKEIRDFSTYKENPDGVLIIHHSMGITDPTFEKIKSLPEKKVLIYHNITPEKYFDDWGTKLAIRKGLEQAKQYKDIADYYVADSNFNRQDLLHMGYENKIDILPVSISLDRFEKIDADRRILDENKETDNILFVGRVVWNKRQLDIVKAFYFYKTYFNDKARLFLIGDTSMEGYKQEIKNLIHKLQIEDAVVLTGKVSEQELKAYYQSAKVFLCLSEHEGFGVPLLEAMKMQIPVVAFRSSAIAETMGGAGIIAERKNYAWIGALLDELVNNHDLSQRIIESQNERIERMEKMDSSSILLNAVKNIEGERKKTIQIQGPFESSYSLAVVNRKLAQALDDAGRADVSIYCTEGPGDYMPKEKDLADKPHARRLWEKSKQVPYPDVTIRNMYPPRVHDVKGGINLQSFGWEESIIPHEYIENFNRYLNGIGTMSDYVTQKLIECGIKIPVKTMGNGVELSSGFERIAPYPLKTKRKVKFLHISSAFPRKGVDVLLEAYFEAFTKNDDVCLVLKTFPNPHNAVGEILDKLYGRYPNAPEVEWIDKDLPQEKLESLYKAADCYVSVARGEGFGLPVAEAMLARVPVIVSPNSGMADFCNENTALLVGYDLMPARTHLLAGKESSLWAEPRKEELIRKFHEFLNGYQDHGFEKMINSAYELISTQFTWEAVAQHWYDFIDEVEKKQRVPKVDMVTTWNNKCGIAEYTRMQVEASDRCVDYRIHPNKVSELQREDETFVQPRTWENAFEGNMDKLVTQLLNSPGEIVHFQFNFGFFKLENLSNAIEKLNKMKKIIITFHKTADADVSGKVVSLKKITKALNKCSALVVHQQADKDYLESIGVDKGRIKLICLGQLQYPFVPVSHAKAKQRIVSSLVIGSYGFLLPHKGILDVIRAMPRILKEYPDAVYMPVCAKHTSPKSEEYLKACLEEIKILGLEDHVKMVTDYLDNDQSMGYLQACDLMCMVYHPSMESASGAIRFCLAAKRPTIVTNQPIFAEFSDFTYSIEKSDPDLISKAVLELSRDREAKNRLVQGVDAYIADKNWYTTAQRYWSLYMEVLGN